MTHNHVEQSTGGLNVYLNFWKDEKAFLQYLRGQSRRIWSRYPVKSIFKSSKTQPNFKDSGITSPRVKKVGVCNQCNNWFASSHLEVDHIVAAGSFSNWEEYCQWFARLLLLDKGEDNLQLLCNGCHTIKTHADKLNISFEEATKAKDVIAFSKLSVDKQKEKLLSCGIEPTRTKVGRVRQYEDIIKLE